MNKMKYVMFRDGTYILLPLRADHSSAARLNPNIHSAGFVQFYKDDDGIIQAKCFGESHSLSTLDRKIKADPEHDEFIINIDLRG